MEKYWTEPNITIIGASPNPPRSSGKDTNSAHYKKYPGNTTRKQEY